MAKKTQKRPVRQERDQSGCMWGLISMFDFRHGRTTQKLISDKRRGTRNVAASGKALNKPELFIDSDQNCLATAGSDEYVVGAWDADKPSVKKLMEEEMYCEEDAKEINIAEAEPIQFNQEDGGSKKKTHRRTTKNHPKSGEIFADGIGTARDAEFERPGHQNSEVQSTSDSNMDVLMEEFFRQIHHINTKHGQHEETYKNAKQLNPEFEEKLSEAIKFFIAQRLVNGKHETGEAEIYPSKELKDALKILSSDEELSLKLLQGPTSFMVQYFENLWNARVEKDGVSKSTVGSNLSKPENCDSKQTEKVTHSKERKFFRRKAKYSDKHQSKEDKASQGSKTIVILKPGTGALEKPDAEGRHGPTPEDRIDIRTPEPQISIRNKGPNERVGSHFFLTEIKRRLKQAMGKEQHETPRNGVSKNFFEGHQAKGDDGRRYKENAGINSPSKDHFFIEKMARPPIGMNMRERMSKDHRTTIYPRQRLSNIYTEAKKHLAEMFTSGTGDSDFSNRQVPKSLGRILSLPEYSVSPVGSPGRDRERNFVTSQTRFSAAAKFEKHENNASHLCQETPNLDAELCPSDASTHTKAEASSNPNTRVSHEIVDDHEVEINSCTIEDKTTIKGDVDVAKTTEILIQAEGVIVDALSESNKSLMTRNDQDANILEVCDTKGFSECLKHYLDEEHQPRVPPSVPTSPPSASLNKKDYNPDGAVEVPERQSPVSVLEPLFIEEDISPASIRSHPADLPIRPLRIKFEELVPSTADPGTNLKPCIQFEDSIYDYVEAVLQASELNWDEFYIMSNSSDPLLDPSIFDEVGFLPNQLCEDKKLLFDCINEGLMEVYGRYFGFPLGPSFSKSTTRPAPDLKHAIYEVWRGVCWHLVPLPVPRTLELIVNKDMARTGTWMDMQCDCEAMIVEICEAIFCDLLEETVSGCINERSENGNTSVRVELMDENSVDS